ncbi:MAG: Holliday junction branch migration protein RuvA [Candidatus Peribacteraceae bacterium]|nr:Holliday junction branch migration protein RuvA [Candidatus Peribacteraceae bacterium]
MIALLRGTVRRHAPGLVTVDVGGVGYRVAVPLSVWDELKEGEERELTIESYVREDRFDLFGFTDSTTQMLFKEAIDMPGIGPKTALEICSVPRHVLAQAISAQDAKLLTAIKGVGKKTAEKLLVDLKSLMEKEPRIFHVAEGLRRSAHEFDEDAVAALHSLGYESSTIMQVLKSLPKDLETTEERVAAALRSL